MNSLIKTRLLLGVLFFTCSFLYGAETTAEDPYPTNYQFYEKDDCIKVKITFPIGTVSESTLYKINNPDSKSVAVRIKNDQLEHLETFYQLVDIEIYATPSQEEGGVLFEIIEHLERKSTDREILKDEITNSSKYFMKTDKQVNFRNTVIPRLTFNGKSHHIKYVKFFTKP